MKADPEVSGHPRWSRVLLVLAAILTLLAVFSIWANRQALNTDNWVSTSSRFLADKAIDEQISDYLGEQFTGERVKVKLEEELPPRLAPLGAAVATGLHQLAPQIAERALQNSHVQALWADANRAAHERLLEVLDGGGKTLSTENGEVTLNLRPLVEHLAKEAGVGSGIAEHIPLDAGKLVILRSDQLSAAQKGAHVVRELPVFLTLLALALYVAAVWLAGPGRRRRALRSVGVCFIVVGVLVLLLRTLGGNVLVGALVKRETAEPAAHAAWDIATSLLKTVATSVLAFGILVFLAAWLAGPTKIATRLRAEAAPYVNASRWAVFGAALAVLVILIAWRPVTAFGKPLGMVLLAVLLAAGAEIIRLQIRREHPDAKLRESAG
ncbi:MAG TPA: hypothetical protein VHZ54_19865 [Solirubrobacterales bacterium]|nr:hypothetical protein [Solirubrobacterales bacterium]